MSIEWADWGSVTEAISRWNRAQIQEQRHLIAAALDNCIEMARGGDWRGLEALLKSCAAGESFPKELLPKEEG